MKSLHNLINTATRKAMEQDRHIKEVISRIVPATTLAHVQFCRLEGGRMRITVDNAAWVSKLRFNERQIIGALRNEQLDVITMSLHVAPAETPVIRTTVRTANRSTNSAAARALSRIAQMTQAEADAADETEAGAWGSDDAQMSCNAESEARVSDVDDSESEVSQQKGKSGDRYSSVSNPDARNSPSRSSVVRNADDRFRQELLKLAEKLRNES